MRFPGVYPLFEREMEKYNTVWIISDLHFRDKELKQAFPNRPSDEELVKLINASVGKKDLLIILGDCGDVSYIAKLRGEKWLILGNHDAGASNYERKYDNIPYSKSKYTKDQVKEIVKQNYSNYNCNIEYNDSYWIVKIDNKLIDPHFIFTGPIVIGEKLILSHEPVDVDWAMNIHGHNHNSKRNDENHYNCCLDSCGYKPLNFNQFLKSGKTAHIKSLHRDIIDTATERKKRRKVNFV